jgi:hypothetical protein
MSKIKRKQIDLKLTSGPAGSAYGSFNAPGLANSDTLEAAMGKLVTVLDKLAPPKPPYINDSSVQFVLSNGTMVTALTATTGISVSNIFKPSVQNTYKPKFISPAADAGPIATGASPYSKYFYDGSAGYLMVDTNITDVINIGALAPATTTTSVTTTAINGNTADKIITIEDRRDYWEGVVGKKDFWKALRASLQFETLAPATTEYTTVLKHVTKADGTAPTATVPLSVRIDKNAVTDNPSVTNFMVSGVTHTSNHKVSGVPTLTSTDTYNFTWNMNNVVKSYYKANPVSFTPQSNSLIYPTWSFASIPSTNSAQTGNVISAQVATNKFIEKPTVTLTASDSMGYTGAMSLVPSEYNKIRVDTVSNITTDTNKRVLSGLTKYDSSNLGTGYNHAEVIKGNANSLYNVELQLENGKYSYPEKDYSGYLPAGPNYTLTTGTRFATFKVGTVTNVKSITITTPGLTQLLQDSNVDNYSIYLKVVNGVGTGASRTSAWVNATRSYSDTAQQKLEITDRIDGAAALMTGSTATSRTVLLNGETISGDVYIKFVISDTFKAQVLTGVPAITDAPAGGTYTNL